MGDFLIGLLIPIEIVVIIFVIILLVVNTKKRTKTTPGITTTSTISTPTTQITSPASKKVGLGIVAGTIVGIIALCVLALGISYAWNFGSSFFEKKEKPIKQLHTEIFEVPITGTYRYLHPGWQAWPTKSITVVTPTGAIIENTPGKPTYPGYQSEGWYQFLTKEKNCQVKTEDVY
jgi:hypothetical protein